MAFQSFNIVIRQRLIETVGHGRSHAQLHQRQHGKHIGKQAVQAQIGLIEIVQEEHTGKEIDQNASQLSDHR